MRTIWRAIVWLMAVAVLHLRLTWAAERGRQLAQDDSGTQPVSTAEELKHAIINKIANIHFTDNFTFPEQTFPEPPATCLQNNPTLDAFIECAPQTIVYTAENPEEKATWTSDPGVVLDASYLFRGIILNRPLDLRDMTFAQIVDDLNPHFFLFGVLRGVSIAYRSCTMLSQCGGKGASEGPAWMDMTLTENFPLATRVVPNDQDVPDSFVYNALSKIPIPGAPTSANIQLLNDTKITCYDLPGPFEAREAPAIWNQGAASTQIRIGDTCQRLETIGADYRGAVNQTIDGPPCETWSVASPLKTATAETLPEFGLGDHNFCRNPDRDARGVWCYAVGDEATKQFCNVPNCTVDDAFIIESGSITSSSSSLSDGAFWGILSSGIALVLAGLLLLCYCCRNRLPCRGAPVRGEMDRVRMELENPRTDVTVDLGGSSAIDGAHSGGVHLPPSKIGAMHGEQPSPADRLEEELRKTMSDAGGESQLQWKEMIGSGAHGDVYRGVWKTLRVAIKSITFNGPEGSAALEDYATSALSCVHANIVKTLQCFRSALAEGPEGSRSEVLDLIHEHCEGGNLATALQSGFFLTPDKRLHNNNVMQVVWEMSVGLNYLHSKGAVHGDMNPRNVLLKGQKASAAGTPHIPCLAEASTNDAVRTHYQSLCEGFVVKITDFGLALTVRQTGAETASPPPGAQFYIAPDESLHDCKRGSYNCIDNNLEALEFGRYTEAADVFSFGVLLWELYHSQTPYKKTQPGFYIRPHIFPKFDEGASLPYAALTVACLHGDPNLRPTMDKVVMILQDMLMASDTQSPRVTTVGVAKDGGTNVTDLIRGTLGEDIESYRSAPAWRGVLEELNGITSSHILDLLTTNHLSDIINIPAPTKQPRNGRGADIPADGHQQGGQRSTQGGANNAATGPGAMNAHGRGPRRASARNPAGAAAERAMGPAGTWDDTLLPGENVEGATGADRQAVVMTGPGGIDRHAAALAAAGGDAAKITMLLHSIDRSPELGHARLHSDVTSEEESEMFEDAKDELMSDDSFFIAQGGAGASASGQLRRMRPPWARGGPGSSMRRATGRVSTDPTTSSADATAAGGLSTSPRVTSNPISSTSMDGLVGRVHGMGSGIMTPPATGDLVSSRSNVSMVSDWDEYGMVKDEATGKTRFNVQMLNFGGRGGMKGVPHSSHSLSQGRGGDGLSHGHQLSSAALTSTTSGIDSNPGTPLASQTLDAQLAGEQPAVPMPPGSASTPGVSSILSTGGAAVAAAAAGTGISPSPTPSGFEDGGAAGSHSEALLADSGTDGKQSTLEDGHGNVDVDEEAAMDVLRWAPAQRAQNTAAAAGRHAGAGGGFDSNASPSQLTASHPTSGGSNSSLSSLSGIDGAKGRAQQPTSASTGQAQGVKSSDNMDSNMNASLSSIGARSSTAHTTLDRLPVMPSGPLSADQPSASVEARAASSSAGLHGRDSPMTSGGRGASRLTSGTTSMETGGSMNVPPLHAGRHAAAHLANRPGVVSADSPKAIAVPNIIVKGRAARSFDGMKLGEFRPMAMRSDRIRSYDGAQASGRGSAHPLSGSTRMSPGTSMRGPSEEGTSRGLMGLQSLFDSAENSDGGHGSDRDQVGLADVMKRGLDGAANPATGEHAPRSKGDATGAADSSTKEGKSKKDKSVRSGGSAKGGSQAEKAARKAAKRARKLQAAQARTGLDMEKLRKEGQASGSEGSPLSMRDLDVSHTSHVVSDTTSATPPVGSGEQALPASADATSPGASAAAAAPAPPLPGSGSAASVSSSTNDGVGIDLNPKHARGGAIGGRATAGWRMSADMIARQHGSGRRSAADMSKLQASGGSSKSGKAPAKAGLKQEATDAAGKSTNVRMYMHPLLRNNRAAIAHVEKIQLKGTDDTSGSGTRGSSMEHARTTSSGPQSSNARSSQARSHNSGTGSGAADRVTM